MVQVELAVPAVVDGVAEVHELRRRADVELRALEDGEVSVPWYFSAFSCASVQRAGARHSSISRSAASPGRPKLLDAPRHAGPVDQQPISRVRGPGREFVQRDNRTKRLGSLIQNGALAQCYKVNNDKRSALTRQTTSTPSVVTTPGADHRRTVRCIVEEGCFHGNGQTRRRTPGSPGASSGTTSGRSAGC